MLITGAHISLHQKFQSTAATVNITTNICGTGGYSDIVTTILNAAGKPVASQTQKNIHIGALQTVTEVFNIQSPVLWSLENPHQYKAVTKVITNG